MAIQQALFYNFIETTLVLLVLAFTPAHSYIRPALLPVVFVLTFYTLPLNNEAFPHVVIHGLLCFHTVGLLLQYIDYVLISRWTYSAGGPTSSVGGERNIKSESDKGSVTHGNLWTRLYWGLFAATAWRAPATPWEANGTPPFKQVPGRVKFLAGHLVRLVISLLVLDALSLAPKDSGENNAAKFAWSQVRLFMPPEHLSHDAFTLRVATVCAFWIASYFSIQAFFSSMAILGVATGVTPVRVWPPIFGSLTQGYTVRTFWGNFWHQSVRRKTSGPAYYLTYRVLRLRKGGIIARYMYILLAFMVSSLLHLAAEEYADGIRWGESGTLRFFFMQWLGIVLEDVAQSLGRTLTGYQLNRWTKALGFVWVAFWLFWTTPSFFYPRMARLNGSEPDPLPLSVAQPLAEYLSRRWLA
ncbi:tat pathway signal sequence [Lophiotrema nucula]|uniref:Tat pathway signal sequence n=1 Tax=Lophiotrema nucula TaxID=690887 RepID=A0A6A5ZMV5_9PLEO|nr:tat pathway signal sequence [Lophiotrema nucula]